MASNPKFGIHTTAHEVAEAYGKRVNGKNVVMTGVSPNGIGEATALAFASQSPANLVLLSRTKSKLDVVADKIRKAHPDVKVQTVILDLCSLPSIREAARQVLASLDKIDLLVNNAGVIMTRRDWMTDASMPEKVDMQFGCNHVGPFLLTNLLMPLLVKGAEGKPPGETRIVNVASAAHGLSPIRFHDWNLEGKEVPPEEDYRKPLPPPFVKPCEDGYLPIIGYSQTKTANILFALSLQKNLASKGIVSYALHPGGVNTDLGRDYDPDLAEAMKGTAKYWKSPEEGASTTMVAALDPALDEIRGLYLDDCQFKDPVPWAADPVAAEKLWHLTERLVGQEFKIAA